MPAASSSSDAATDDLAAVKMEVQRSSPPEPGFLEGVRELCTRKGIVLIFDECTSGFRETFGGLHKKYGVDPDMAMFGKALGNGYAITSVIGRRAVMEAAQSTFISSTFWTESIGPTAAVATLIEMSNQKSWETLPKIGLSVKKIWSSASEEFDIPIKVEGLDALPTFSFLNSFLGLLNCIDCLLDCLLAYLLDCLFACCIKIYSIASRIPPGRGVHWWIFFVFIEF